MEIRAQSRRFARYPLHIYEFVCIIEGLLLTKFFLVSFRALISRTAEDIRKAARVKRKHAAWGGCASFGT